MGLCMNKMYGQYCKLQSGELESLTVFFWYSGDASGFPHVTEC